MLENLYLIFNILSLAIMMNKTFKIPNFIAYNGKQSAESMSYIQRTIIIVSY